MKTCVFLYGKLVIFFMNYLINTIFCGNPHLVLFVNLK